MNPPNPPTNRLPPGLASAGVMAVGMSSLVRSAVEAALRVEELREQVEAVSRVAARVITWEMRHEFRRCAGIAESDVRRFEQDDRGLMAVLWNRRRVRLWSVRVVAAGRLGA